MLFGILPGSEARHWSIKLFGLGEVWASYWRIVSLVYPEASISTSSSSDEHAHCSLLCF